MAYKILLVDDEDAIRLSLRDFLLKKGFEVLVASDGVGALKLLIDEHIDLIITDYRMDIFGGDYWIRFLKKYCPSIKTIITSAYLYSENEVPFPVLFKPFKFKDLWDKIADILKNADGG